MESSAESLVADPGRARVPWLGAALVLATLGAYANSLQGAFLFDDLLIDSATPFRSRPLVRLTFDLNRWISRTDPRGYHAFNVLVHACAGLLLFGLVRRTLDRIRGAGQGKTNAALACAAALLWLVHPLQTESVAYISQRAEALAGLFVLGLFYAFVRSAPGSSDAGDSRGQRLGWSLVALVSFVLGMASKEIVVAVPPLLLFFDRQLLSGGFVAALRRRAPFYALLAALWLGLFLVLSGGLIGEAFEPIELGADPGYGVTAFTPLAYARTQPAVILHYLRLVVWPHPLCLDYSWPAARSPAEYVPQTIVLALLLAATLVLCVRRSWLGFLGAWLFLILAPTSSFLPIQDAAFEHRMYLSLAAPVLAAVVGARALCRRLAPEVSWLPGLLLALVASAFLALTLRRNRDYRSAESIWRSVLAVRPENPRAHRGLALALLAAGAHDEALREIRRTLEIRPLAEDLVNLGRVHFERGELQQALAAFQQAHDDMPFEGKPLFNLGLTYEKLGDRARAIEHYRRAVELEPSVPAWATLANAQSEAGDLAGAEASLAQALASAPANAGLHYSLGNVLQRQGKLEAARAEYEVALRVDPAHAGAHTNLGSSLAALGRRAEALEHFARAAALVPDGALERFNHGRSLLAANRVEEALVELRASAGLDASLWQPREALARALNGKTNASAAERAEALRAAEEAASLSARRVPEVLETLGEARAATGARVEAAAAFEEALALVPAEKNAPLRARLEQRLAALRAGGR